MGGMLALSTCASTGDGRRVRIGSGGAKDTPAYPAQAKHVAESIPGAQLELIDNVGTRSESGQIPRELASRHRLGERERLSCPHR